MSTLNRAKASIKAIRTEGLKLYPQNDVPSHYDLSAYLKDQIQDLINNNDWDRDALEYLDNEYESAACVGD